MLKASVDSSAQDDGLAICKISFSLLEQVLLLPSSMKINGIASHLGESRTALLRLQSPEFPKLPECSVIPQIHLVYEREPCGHDKYKEFVWVQ